MKKRFVLLAGVLAIGMTVSSAAWGEEPSSDSDSALVSLLGSLLSEDGPVSGLLSEDGALGDLLGEDGTLSSLGGSISNLLENDETLNKLFGTDGPLAGVLSGDMDLSDTLQAVGEKLEEGGSVLYQTIEGAVDQIKSEDGSIDWAKAGEAVGDLIGAVAGGDSAADDYDLEELLDWYNHMDDLMGEYLFETDAASLEPGDVQICSKQTAYTDEEMDADVYRALAKFTLCNYVIDGDEMKLKNSAAFPALITLTKGEDGEYTVTDARFTEDGEGYTASLEALCSEVGITLEDYDVSMVLGVYNDADAAAEYLEEHPEIRTAEYQGEQLTAEELRALSDAYINDLMDSIFDSDEAEEALTEAAEEALTEAE